MSRDPRREVLGIHQRAIGRATGADDRDRLTRQNADVTQSEEAGRGIGQVAQGRGILVRQHRHEGSAGAREGLALLPQVAPHLHLDKPPQGARASAQPLRQLGGTGAEHLGGSAEVLDHGCREPLALLQPGQHEPVVEVGAVLGA